MSSIEPYTIFKGDRSIKIITDSNKKLLHVKYQPIKQELLGSSEDYILQLKTTKHGSLLNLVPLKLSFKFKIKELCLSSPQFDIEELDQSC